MSEQKECNELTFEEKIVETLKGDTQKDALNFVAFLKANNLSTGDNHGTIVFNGDVLAWMHMDGKPDLPGPWTIWPDLIGTVPEGFIFEEAMKEVAWQNINICASCGGECAPGNKKSVFGKEFDNVCGAMLAFTDPDCESLECLKKLIEMRKYAMNVGE